MPGAEGRLSDFVDDYQLIRRPDPTRALFNDLAPLANPVAMPPPAPLVDDYKLFPGEASIAARSDWEHLVGDPFMQNSIGLQGIPDSLGQLLGVVPPAVAARNREARQWEEQSFRAPTGDRAAMQQVLELPGPLEFGANLIAHPQTIAQGFAGSIPSLAPRVAGTALGAGGGALFGGPLGAIIGGRVGWGAGALATEYGASVDDFIQGDPRVASGAMSLEQAYSDPQLMQEAQVAAAIRAGVITLVEAGTMAAAPRVAAFAAGGATKAGAGPVASKLAGYGAEAGTQIAGAMTGEAGAQQLSTGEVQPGPVMFEGLVEVPGMVVEHGVNAALGAIRPKPQAAGPQVGPAPGPAPAVPAAPFVDDYDFIGPRQPSMVATPPVEAENVPVEGAEVAAPTVSPEPTLPATGPPGGPLMTPPGQMSLPETPAPAVPPQATPSPEAQKPAEGYPEQIEVSPRGLQAAAPAAVTIPEIVTPEASQAIAESQPETQPSKTETAPNIPQTVIPQGRGKASGEYVERAAIVAPGQPDVQTRYELVEGSELQAGAGRDQPRDRSRRGSEIQTLEHAANFDPRLVGEDISLDRGAPVLAPEGGMLAGSGRRKLLDLVQDQHPEKFERYLQHLRDLGYDPTGMARPRLVRRVMGDLTPEQRRAIGVDTNKPTGLRYSAAEQAHIDAELITPQMLAEYDTEAEGGVTAASNRGFITAMRGKMTANEQGDLMTADQSALSPEGETRLQNALVARAYSDPKLVTALAEAEEGPSVRNALGGAAAAWANMREQAPGWDMTEDLTAGLDLLNRARRNNQWLDNYVNQIDAFGEPEPQRRIDAARLFLNADGTRLARWQEIRDRLKAYANAGVEAEAGTPSLMGDALTPEQALQNILAGARQKGAGAPSASAPAAPQPEQTNLLGEQPLAVKPKKKAAPPPPEEGGMFDTDEPVAKSARAAAKKRGGLDEQAHDLATQIDRRPRGPLSSPTQLAAFSAGLAKSDLAWLDMGRDPDEANALPLKQQAKLLADHVKQVFGFKDVEFRAINTLEGVNQLKDGFTGMQALTAGLGMPRSSLGLDGTVTLALERNNKRYFGQYDSGTRTLHLPGRTNSFSHEWMHALDHWLMDRLKKIPVGLANFLSTLTRAEGLDIRGRPEAAFVNLLNEMGFGADNIRDVIKALDLEQRAAAVNAKSGKPTSDATKAQEQLDHIYAGNTRLNQPPRKGQQQRAVLQETKFKTGGRVLDVARGGDYYARTHELLARAFEAYVANRLARLGFTGEFVAKPNAAYSADADARFRLGFPKEQEADRIFMAMDGLFAALAADNIWNGPPDAADPRGQTDPDHWLKLSSHKQNGPLIKRIAAELRTSGTQIAESFADIPGTASNYVERLGYPVGSPLGKVALATLKTTASDLAWIAGSTRNNVAVVLAAAKLRGKGELIDAAWHLLGTSPGRNVEQRMNLGEREQMMTNTELRRLEALIRQNNKNNPNLKKADSKLLYDRAISGDLTGLTPGQRNIVVGIRTMLNRYYTMQQESGIDLGLVDEEGYIPRAPDLGKAAEDVKGFEKAAKQQYANEFDSVMDEFTDDQVVKMANALASTLAQEAALKKFRKAMRDLEDAQGAGQTPAHRAAAAAAAAARDKARADLLAEMKDPWAEESTRKLSTALFQGHVYTTIHRPGFMADHTKPRKWGPGAHKIMGDYLVQDLEGLMRNYIFAMAHQIAIRETLGTLGGNYDFDSFIKQPDIAAQIAEHPIKFNPTTNAGQVNIVLDLANAKSGVDKYAMLIELAKVDRADGQVMQEVFENITGLQTSRSVGGAKGIRLARTFTAYATLRMMGQVMLASLPEASAMFGRSGNLAHAGMTWLRTVHDFIPNASREAREDFAQAIGLLASQYLDMTAMVRLGVDNPNTIRGLDHAAQTMMTKTGLIGLTNIQRGAVAHTAFMVLQGMAMRASKKAGPGRGIMEAEFAELGVTNDKLAEVATWLRQWTSLPPGAAMTDVNDQIGMLVGRMVFRYTNQVIQSPTRADKPIWANGSFGKVLLQFTPFQWAFWANIVQPSVTRTARNMQIADQTGAAAGQSGLGRAGAVGQQLVSGLAGRVIGFALMAWFGQFLLTVAREAVTNGDDWERRVEEEGEEAQWEHLRNLAFDRLGINHPWGTKAQNIATGRLFQADVSNTFLGPFGGAVTQDIGAAYDYFVRNTGKTLTQERNAMRRFWQGGVGPMTNWAISSMNLPPVLLPLQWAAMWTLPKLDTWAADTFIGPKEPPKQPKGRGAPRDIPERGGGARKVPERVLP